MMLHPFILHERKNISFLIYLTLFLSGSAQDSTAKYVDRYQWILYDNPNQHQTLRQNVTNLQTVNRLVTKTTKKYFSSLGHVMSQAGLSLFVTIPLQQAQAQRSVLTSLGISSEYEPYSMILPEPAVLRVSDIELNALRNSDFASFRRLFSVGSESNFLWLNQYNRQVAFGYEQYRNINVDYILRMVISYSYYLPSILSFLEDDNSSSDQRITNIVAYAYIYNSSPDRSFTRNIAFSDLTKFEMRRIKSIAYLSFTNLISTVLVSKRAIALAQSTNLHFALTQFLSPGGEVYTQSFWLVNSSKNQYLEGYIREIVNAKSVFPGIGIALHNLPVRQDIQINVTSDLWTQPENQGYYERKKQIGGALELQGSLAVKTRKTRETHEWLVNFSILRKSDGFKPGILQLDKGWLFSIGLEFHLPR